MSRARWIATFAGALLTFAAVATLPALDAALPGIAARKARAAPPGPFGERLIPAPLLSRGKRVVTSSGDGDALVDGAYRTGAKWGGGEPSPSRPAWASIELGRGPSRLLLSWTSSGNHDYWDQFYGAPVDYRIEVSADSTDGRDGTWQTVVDVQGQPGPRPGPLLPLRRDELGPDVGDAAAREGQRVGALHRRDRRPRSLRRRERRLGVPGRQHHLRDRRPRHPSPPGVPGPDRRAPPGLPPGDDQRRARPLQDLRGAREDRPAPRAQPGRARLGDPDRRQRRHARDGAGLAAPADRAAEGRREDPRRRQDRVPDQVRTGLRRRQERHARRGGPRRRGSARGRISTRGSRPTPSGCATACTPTTRGRSS